MRREQQGGLPKEVQEQALREKIRKEYPFLYMDYFLLVDTQTTRLVIDDISYRAQAPVKDEIETLTLSCKGWVEVYDARALTFALAQKISRLLNTVDPRRTLIIFPGNGARVVKDLLPQDLLGDIKSLELPAQRKITSNGIVDGVTLYDITRARKVAGDIRLETLIVLDDVIVTGATLTATREAFPGRSVEAFAGSLFTLSPLQRKRTNKSTSIEDYRFIITSIVYQGATGIPPLNSLSTLIGDSEKSNTVRTKYLQDYVEDKKTFLEAVKQLRAKCVL